MIVNVAIQPISLLTHKIIQCILVRQAMGGGDPNSTKLFFPKKSLLLFMPPRNPKKRSIAEIYDDEGNKWQIEVANPWKKRMKVSQLANTPNGRRFLDKHKIPYNYRHKNHSNKENICPNNNYTKRTSIKPNKHTKRYSNNICIKPPTNPPYPTHYQHRNNSICNEIVDINRLNQMLSDSQHKLIEHVTNHKDMQHRNTTPVIQFKVAKHNGKVGRYGQCYCSVCGQVIHEELLHPNVEISIDDDKPFKASLLDIQLVIACQEARIKQRGLNMFQFITSLPLTTHTRFWR